MNKPGEGEVKQRRAREAAAPLVGIFWCFRGRLLVAAVPVADGLRYGDAVHSRVDHVRYWPELQRQIKALRDLDYEQVPRGRVVFHELENRFCAYMDKKLHTDKVKRMLRAQFHLPNRRTQFLTDPHYTTDRGDLAALFDT